MNNTCKLLTSIAVLAAFCSGAMEESVNADLEVMNWARSKECERFRYFQPNREQNIQGFLSSGHHCVDRALIDSGLLNGIDFETPQRPYGRTVLRTAIENGMSLSLHFAAAEGAHVSTDDVIKCLLAADSGRWGSGDFELMAVRLIVLAAGQERVDPRVVLDKIKDQAAQNPQKSHALLGFLNSPATGFESILQEWQYTL
ncbi:MAG: hypothetical protein LBD15_02875 [Holosporales bacterium]|nr:hypothetical protein [Holosporales bacterium]